MSFNCSVSGLWCEIPEQHYRAECQETKRISHDARAKSCMSRSQQGRGESHSRIEAFSQKLHQDKLLDSRSAFSPSHEKTSQKANFSLSSVGSSKRRKEQHKRRNRDEEAAAEKKSLNKYEKHFSFSALPDCKTFSLKIWFIAFLYDEVKTCFTCSSCRFSRSQLAGWLAGWLARETVAIRNVFSLAVALALSERQRRKKAEEINVISLSARHHELSFRESLFAILRELEIRMEISRRTRERNGWFEWKVFPFLGWMDRCNLRSYFFLLHSALGFINYHEVSVLLWWLPHCRELLVRSPCAGFLFTRIFISSRLLLTRRGWNELKQIASGVAQHLYASCSCFGGELVS
jgi:hypothetical protein